MGENSKIEWTDHTFNPWVGCQKVGPGCANCYAEREMTRKTRWANAWGPPATSERIRTTDAYWRKPIIWNRKAEQSGTIPRVFCGSLCDVFEDNPALIGWRRDLLALIEKTPRLDWLLLTKRPQNVVPMIEAHVPSAKRWFAKHRHAQVGTSVENQQTADERIPPLLQIPAPIRFLSIEPMLDEIDLSWFACEYCRGESTISLAEHHGKRECKRCNGKGIELNWVIVGGESGPNARPMNPEWARLIRDQCQSGSVPFFMKQMSGKRPKSVPIPKDLMIREFPEL